jgi:hypothetical protein
MTKNGLGDILGVILGVILGDILGNIFGDILGDILGDIWATFWATFSRAHLVTVRGGDLQAVERGRNFNGSWHG